MKNGSECRSAAPNSLPEPQQPGVEQKATAGVHARFSKKCCLRNSSNFVSGCVRASRTPSTRSCFGRESFCTPTSPTSTGTSHPPHGTLLRRTVRFFQKHKNSTLSVGFTVLGVLHCHRTTRASVVQPGCSLVQHYTAAAACKIIKNRIFLVQKHRFREENLCFRPSNPLRPTRNNVVLGVPVVAELFTKFREFRRQHFFEKRVGVQPAAPRLPFPRHQHQKNFKAVFLKSVIPDPHETLQAAA